MNRKSRYSELRYERHFAHVILKERRHNQSYVCSLELASIPSEMSSTNTKSCSLVLNSSARPTPHQDTNSHLLRLQQCRLQKYTPLIGRIGHATYQSNRLLVITRGLYPFLAGVPIRMLHLFRMLVLGPHLRYAPGAATPRLCFTTTWHDLVDASA